MVGISTRTIADVAPCWCGTVRRTGERFLHDVRLYRLVSTSKYEGAIDEVLVSARDREIEYSTVRSITVLYVSPDSPRWKMNKRNEVGLGSALL